MKNRLIIAALLITGASFLGNVLRIPEPVNKVVLELKKEEDKQQTESQIQHALRNDCWGK